MADQMIERMSHTLEQFLGMVVDFLPHLLAMVIIILIGWFIAWVLKVSVRRLLTLLKFDTFSEKSGVTVTLTRLGLPLPSELTGRVVFWLVWVSFMFLGVSALGIPSLQEEITRFFDFLPHIFGALVILYFGLLAAHFFSRAALLAAVNANLPTPRLLGSFVRLTIGILAVTMALEQLGLARAAVLIAFAITFGAIMLSFAIAFGVGGQAVARRMLEKHFLEKEEEKEEEISPL
jgi:Mechanosensitive ion channel, conserved TM helix